MPSLSSPTLTPQVPHERVRIHVPRRRRAKAPSDLPHVPDARLDCALTAATRSQIQLPPIQSSRPLGWYRLRQNVILVHIHQG